ncbi:hypothetical protein FRC08_002518 [Ceratobasidium sp. 394]|nr:hypothetical protein FRC08_002518 [Ceratobasidium sp. 394]
MSDGFYDHNLPENPLPFIVAQYENHKVTIRRNPNYAQTISLIKSAFRGLQSTPTWKIQICIRLPGIGDVQVTEDLWKDLLPKLLLVTVSLHETSASSMQNFSRPDNFTWG